MALVVAVTGRAGPVPTVQPGGQSCGKRRWGGREAQDPQPRVPPRTLRAPSPLGLPSSPRTLNSPPPFSWSPARSPSSAFSRPAAARRDPKAAGWGEPQRACLAPSLFPPRPLGLCSVGPIRPQVVTLCPPSLSAFSLPAHLASSPPSFPTMEKGDKGWSQAPGPPSVNCPHAMLLPGQIPAHLHSDARRPSGSGGRPRSPSRGRRPHPRSTAPRTGPWSARSSGQRCWSHTCSGPPGMGGWLLRSRETDRVSAHPHPPAWEPTDPESPSQSCQHVPSAGARCGPALSALGLARRFSPRPLARCQPWDPSRTTSPCPKPFLESTYFQDWTSGDT